MHAVVEAGALLGSGILAGLVGTAGGVTSLISYPALLIAGLPARAANVSNIIALVACWPGSALASRPELAGRDRWVRRWTPVAAAGGATGSALLLATPAGTFSRVVPMLVALASLSPLAQPQLAARHTRRSSRLGRFALPVGLAAVSLYNGYFGAGAGVMALGLLLLTADGDLLTANAMKNMLIGAATLTSALTLVAAGPVDWVATGPLATGMFLGATLGPRVARRVPATFLRWGVAVLGLALAADLFAHSGG